MPRHFEFIANPRDERRFRPNHRQVRPEPLGQSDEGWHIARVHRHAFGYVRNSAIARRAPNFSTSGD